MTDYSLLESRLKKFRNKFEGYRELCNKILNHPDSPKRDTNLVKEERKMRGKLEEGYGELQADIHGMAGYNVLDIRGKELDIFLSALDPRLDKSNFIKFLGLDFSIQCLNKAIGSCRYAKSVKETDDEIIIEKGAAYRGLLVLRKIFNKANKSIIIQDRYLSADIFNFIDEIDKRIDIRILVKAEGYNQKSMLKAVYEKYKNNYNNVEIRELTQKQFHPRKWIIDDTKGYIPDFTLQDIGKSESIIKKIKDLKKLKKSFCTLWSESESLLTETN